jgi:hypothetical protein
MDLANQQSQAQSALLAQQTTANRPNTTTPFGTTNWTQGPGGTWSGSSTLNPALTQALGSQEWEQAQQLGVGQNLLNSNIGAGTFNPLDYSKGPQVQSGNYYVPQAQNAVWNQFQGMEEPLMHQQTEQQQSQLEAQGLRPGDTAYDNAMRNLSNTQYQQTQAAQNQAVLAGEQEAQTMQGMDVQAQQQYMAMLSGQQNQNMNLLNSVMGTNPNLGTSQIGAAQAGVAQAPNLLGAAEQMYGAQLNSTNASNAANSNLWQGLGSLAGDAAMIAMA